MWLAISELPAAPNTGECFEGGCPRSPVERHQMIDDALRSLDVDECRALILHKYRKLDCAGIARVLGVSKAVAKSLLFAAYENLRLRLEPLLSPEQGAEADSISPAIAKTRHPNTVNSKAQHQRASRSPYEPG
jgi:hypothetical protein